jgi:hypothetical protein
MMNEIVNFVEAGSCLVHEVDRRVQVLAEVFLAMLESVVSELEQ